MNLNYENLSLEGISDETLRKYSFPKNKVFIKRYMEGGSTLKTFREQEEETKQLSRGVYLLSASFVLGALGYFSLLAPGGKVLRDAYDKTLSRPRRVLRRVLPFALMVFPFIAVKELINKKTYDYKSWGPKEK